MKRLITYKEALYLTEEYNNLNFSKSEFIINAYDVVLFKYFLCDFRHFENPIPGTDIHGYDMRGMTFVFNKDGTLYKRFLMMPKFFNLDQVETTQYDVVRKKQIKYITNKEDGSLIAFMELPNGEVFAKTIGSFSNEQVDAAMSIYNSDEKLQSFIKVLHAVDCTPLFEYVSLDNRIVLKYGNPELRFLGVRNNETGDYLNHSALMIESPVKCAEVYRDKTLRELIELSKTVEDKEGWVVEFEDGQMIKVKTTWYFKLHSLRTDNIFREDFIIESYLSEKIDDIYSQLDKKNDTDAFSFIKRVISAVNHYIYFIDDNVKMLYDKYYNFYKENWTLFATEEHKSPFFNLTITYIKNRENYNIMKSEFIINSTKRLKKARLFVDKWTKENDKIISKWKNN